MAESIEIRFTLNGEERVVQADPKRSTLTVLREDLGITTLKPGCDPQGICGCCAALVDGKPRLTCTLPVKSVAGKAVLTQDGLSPLEQIAFSEAFATTGGTQCGYCTPGIVMASKALVDKTPDPSDEDIAKALQMHVCRCTGWVKINDAIHLAARWLREGQVDAGVEPGKIGSSWHKAEIRDAVLGRRPYVDDMTRPGLLYGAVVWTPFPRCRIVRVDTDAAAALPGVRAICTADDAPADRRVGVLFHDWPFLVAVGEETRCSADIIAIVAADTPDHARAAAAAITVEAEELAALTDVETAAQDPANVLETCRVVRGDALEVMQASAHVVTQDFQTPMIDQAFLEPEAALAVPLDNSGWKVYSPGQGIHDEHRQLCHLFRLPPDRLVVEGVATGGAFGAKEDLGVQPHALLLAMKTGRPVKLALSMEESTRFHPKRHAFKMSFRLGCDASGHLTALDARILGDTGGYASVGTKVLERAASHAAGPYRVPAVHIEALTVLTNNPVAGAMRGFGAPQVNFALEGCIDRLAAELGLDPLEMRARNLLRPGDRFATGQLMDEGCSAAATLEALRPYYEAARAAGKHVGVACAIKNVGMGNGYDEKGRAALEVLSATEIRIHTPFTEMGQGHESAMILMAAELTGLSTALFSVRTSSALDIGVGMTTASRATVLGGRALQAASGPFADALSLAGGDLGHLVGQLFHGEWIAPKTDPAGDIPREGHDPRTHFSFGYGAQLAIVGADGKVEEIVAVHDAGKVIQRAACEGQIEGAVHMGLGFALSEELVVDARGVPDTKFRNLGVIKPKGMPKITTVLLECADPAGPWGARGVGEIGLVPTASAIAAALHSHDGVWRTRLPMRDTAAAKAVGARTK